MLVGEFNLYRIKRYIVISDIVLCDVDVMYFHTTQNGTAESYRNKRYIVLSDIVLSEVHCNYLQLVLRSVTDCSAAVSLCHLKEGVQLLQNLQKHVCRTTCIM